MPVGSGGCEESTFPNTQKRVENRTRNGVFLTNFEVFGNVVKHCVECFIHLLNRVSYIFSIVFHTSSQSKLKEKREKQN